MLKIEITLRLVPEEEPEKDPRGEYADAFDDMMGDPLAMLDDLIASIRAGDQRKRGRHAE